MWPSFSMGLCGDQCRRLRRSWDDVACGRGYRDCNDLVRSVCEVAYAPVLSVTTRSKIRGHHSVRVLQASWKIVDVTNCGPVLCRVAEQPLFRSSVAHTRPARDRVDHDALRTRLFRAFAVQPLPAAVATTTVLISSLDSFSGVRIVFFWLPLLCDLQLYSVTKNRKITPNVRRFWKLEVKYPTPQVLAHVDDLTSISISLLYSPVSGPAPDSIQSIKKPCPTVYI